LTSCCTKASSRPSLSRSRSGRDEAPSSATGRGHVSGYSCPMQVDLRRRQPSQVVLEETEEVHLTLRLLHSQQLLVPLRILLAGRSSGARPILQPAMSPGGSLSSRRGGWVGSIKVRIAADEGETTCCSAGDRGGCGGGRVTAPIGQHRAGQGILILGPWLGRRTLGEAASGGCGLVAGNARQRRVGLAARSLHGTSGRQRVRCRGARWRTRQEMERPGDNGTRL